MIYAAAPQITKMKRRIFLKTEMQAKVAVECLVGWFKTFFFTWVSLEVLLAPGKYK